MTPDTQPKVCLYVAVDHRIRRLFKPVNNELTEPSDHLSDIEARGCSLKRPLSEIEVTMQLADPALKGGIAVALQQPRHNHQFEKGLDAVIQDCETLHALDDVFSAVSCGSLNIRTDIAVFDLLPYESEYIENIDDAKLEESFRVSKRIVLHKEPDVLLCAGRIWLPKGSKASKKRWDTEKLESIGIGQKFGSTRRHAATVRIHHEEQRRSVTIRRVNGFHPSCAMNYNPHVSRLRQLRILIGAETCGTLRGDWEEKEWMGELRSQDLTGVATESPTQSPRPQRLDQTSTRRNDAKYLPEYQGLYRNKLDSIDECVWSLISEPTPAMESSTGLYKRLLSSGLSEICNDASLILRKMSLLQIKGWPEYKARKNNAALEEAARDTVRFADVIKATDPGEDTPFEEIIQEGARLLRESVSGSGRRFDKYKLDFNKACEAFLIIATNIEALLMDLLLEEEKEEVLLSEMRRMTLASSDN